MIFEILKWIFAGSLGGVVTFLFKYREDKRKAHVDDVTKHRIEWTQKLKINIAEFITDIQSYRLVKNAERLTIRKNLIKKMELIEINLNPINDEFDEEYINIMRGLYNNILTHNNEDLNSSLERFRELSQSMVKIEWEGIKLEAKKGDLSKQEKFKLRRKWLV